MSDKPESSAGKAPENTQYSSLSLLNDFSRFDSRFPAFSHKGEKLSQNLNKESKLANDLPSLTLPPIFVSPFQSAKEGVIVVQPNESPAAVNLPQEKRQGETSAGDYSNKKNDKSSHGDKDQSNEASKTIDLKLGLTISADGKIEIGEKDFDKIGPKAAQVLKDAGVTKLTITPGQGFDTYEADLKKELEIAQDPNVDGARKLKIGTHFKADVSKSPDGSYSLEHIEGLKAESKILLAWREAQVDKIQLTKLPDGRSEITSTGSWNGFSRDNTRIKPPEIFEKASMLFGRMETLKGSAGIGQNDQSQRDTPNIKTK